MRIFRFLRWGNGRKSKTNHLKADKVLQFSQQGSKLSQEDFFTISKDQRLFIVCDGVGGNAFGLLASTTVADHIQLKYENHIGKFTSKTFLKYIQSAQDTMNKMAIENPELNGFATTLAMCYISEASLLIFHVGDSKVTFIDKKNSKSWSTKDHSMVQELVDANIISSEEESLNHPLKNVVTRVLKGTSSFKKYAKVDVHEIRSVHQNDLVFMCTDGVMEHFSTTKLENFFLEGESNSRWTQLRDYCAQNSKDNNTAILIIF